MSDHAQIASTGTAGAITLGGTVIAGWWLLAVALGIVLVGALTVRLCFRSGRPVGER
ncbi:MULTISPECIES: hypothetical protein [Streptomyces]|uniref:Peptidase n=1 Tax=Streptomyces lycii TaxID=2654337 RepID=A0ABQ7FSL3_9ACTN|nr:MULTISPECIES: hypothetical protein [Streptomyces]KAF4410767.1 hypothetical protein GCU69_02165 [Streptomyces lycii]